MVFDKIHSDRGGPFSEEDVQYFGKATSTGDDAVTFVKLMFHYVCDVDIVKLLKKRM